MQFAICRWVQTFETPDNLDLTPTADRIAITGTGQRNIVLMQQAQQRLVSFGFYCFVQPGKMYFKFWHELYSVDRFQVKNVSIGIQKRDLFPVGKGLYAL